MESGVEILQYQRIVYSYERKIFVQKNFSSLDYGAGKQSCEKKTALDDPVRESYFMPFLLSEWLLPTSSSIEPRLSRRQSSQRLLLLYKSQMPMEAITVELAEHRVARTHSKHTGRELAKKIRNRSARLGVIGLGYAGLHLTLEMAGKGFRVTGIGYR
jgi:hypothetical protein